MNTDKLAAVSRAVDAAVCWTLAPKWCRGRLKDAVKRAYEREGKSERSAYAYA